MDGDIEYIKQLEEFILQADDAMAKSEGVGIGYFLDEKGKEFLDLIRNKASNSCGDCGDEP